MLKKPLNPAPPKDTKKVFYNNELMGVGTLPFGASVHVFLRERPHTASCRHGARASLPDRADAETDQDTDILRIRLRARIDMDLNKITLFTAMKKRLSWLNQRQAVLSQNIANADTPNYKPRDLKPLDFKKELRGNTFDVKVAATDPRHITSGGRDGGPNMVERERRPYETAPAGNAVVLEEQVLKVSDTLLSHRLTTELYKKHLNILRAAIGRR
jgi:flagellar basal-body rod protein FlgB